MDWRVVALLVVAGVVALVVAVLALVVRSLNRKVTKLRAEVEEWKGRAHNMRDEVERLVALRKFEEMGDDEAIEALREKLAGWSPVDPDGGGAGGG